MIDRNTRSIGDFNSLIGSGTSLPAAPAPSQVASILPPQQPAPSSSVQESGTSQAVLNSESEVHGVSVIDGRSDNLYSNQQ